MREREKKIGKWFRFLRLHLIHNWSECLDYKPFYSGSKLACLLHLDVCAFRTKLGALPCRLCSKKVSALVVTIQLGTSLILPSKK
jgi:hypothetical protein